MLRRHTWSRYPLKADTFPPTTTIGSILKGQNQRNLNGLKRSFYHLYGSKSDAFQPNKFGVEVVSAKSQKSLYIKSL